MQKVVSHRCVCVSVSLSVHTCALAELGEERRE